MSANKRKGVYRRCVTCGHRHCNNMYYNGNYDYCCVDLPPRLITKPARKWLCRRCMGDLLRTQE